jgi:diketogulonate reductase-like aldo/keto reductase
MQVPHGAGPNNPRPGRPVIDRLERLEENIGAADLVLTSDDLRELDDASARIEVQGDRYPERMQRMIDR